MRFPFIRSRTIWYAVVISIVGAVMVWAMLNRVDTDLNVLSDRNPVYVTLSDGSIRNGYTVRLLNKAPEARRYRAELSGLGAATMRWTQGAACSLWARTISSPPACSSPWRPISSMGCSSRVSRKAICGY